MILEKAKKAAITALNKKRSSGSLRKSGGDSKRKKSLESVTHIDIGNTLKDAYAIVDPTVRDNMEDNSENRASHNFVYSSDIENNSKFEIEKVMDSDDDLWEDCYHQSQ